MLESNTSMVTKQEAQYSDFDFAKPLTLIIAPSARYQAMGLALFLAVCT